MANDIKHDLGAGIGFGLKGNDCGTERFVITQPGSDGDTSKRLRWIGVAAGMFIRLEIVRINAMWHKVNGRGWQKGFKKFALTFAEYHNCGKIFQILPAHSPILIETHGMMEGGDQCGGLQAQEPKILFAIKKMVNIGAVEKVVPIPREFEKGVFSRVRMLSDTRLDESLEQVPV